MKPTQSLQLKQSQSLVMTQQLQQSIKLLQLSSAELSAYVAEELERNPLLVRDENQNDENRAEEDSSGESDNSSADDSISESMDDNYGEGWQQEDERGTGQQISAGSYDKPTSTSSSANYSEGPNLEQTLSSDVTLRDHLLEQIQVDLSDPKMRFLGSQLVDMLDEVGYLRDDVTELAKTLDAPTELLNKTIYLLKKLDPSGVFAKDLPECLAIQLAEKNWLDPMMQSFIDNMHLLEKGDIEGLQKACGASAEDMADMLEQIRSLNPHPARLFNNDMAFAVIPDVFVKQGKGGVWQVELNNDVLPRVLVDQHYFNQLDGSGRDKKEKKYISEQFSQANWLIKALDQRAQTILKVSSEIVKQQEKFLLHGIQFLKPLTLKDIALAVDMHESTISRVTTNKFMSTARGIFELKYFFTSSISSAGGSTEISSKTVMYYIKELIEAEPAEKTLSDDSLVKMLKDKNIDVARRTVAKYREAMHIPSSVVRRKQKKSQI